jgi:hypothetical protein
MGEIVNLRRVRKEKARAAARQEAAENRVRHGRDAAARANDARAEARVARVTEGARMESASAPERE